MTLPKHVYHLVEDANYDSIMRLGLKPAIELIAESGEDLAWQYKHRLSHHTLPNGLCLRDQGPMPPQALSKCLHAMTPDEWYFLLNSHVFFWPELERLERQRKACAPRKQHILTFDAERLMKEYARISFVTPINTGFARRKPAKRGLASFVLYEEWRKHGWASEAVALNTNPRPKSHPPVELAVRGSIQDLETFLAK